MFVFLPGGGGSEKKAKQREKENPNLCKTCTLHVYFTSNRVGKWTKSKTTRKCEKRPRANWRQLLGGRSPYTGSDDGDERRPG